MKATLGIPAISISCSSSRHKVSIDFVSALGDTFATCLGSNHMSDLKAYHFESLIISLGQVIFEALHLCFLNYTLKGGN